MLVMHKKISQLLVLNYMIVALRTRKNVLYNASEAKCLRTDYNEESQVNVHIISLTPAVLADTSDQSHKKRILINIGQKSMKYQWMHTHRNILTIFVVTQDLNTCP